MSSVNMLIEELKEISNKKLIDLNKIYDITKKQTNAILNYNVDELNRLTDQKQEQIDDINELDNIFGTKFLQIKKELGLDSLEEVTENKKEFKVIQGFISEIQETVSRIMELEKQNSETAQDLQREVKESMQQTGKDKKILQGYNPHNISSPIYFDKKK